MKAKCFLRVPLRRREVPTPLKIYMYEDLQINSTKCDLSDSPPEQKGTHPPPKEIFV
jgi:hypothetical protein